LPRNCSKGPFLWGGGSRPPTEYAFRVSSCLHDDMPLRGSYVPVIGMIRDGFQTGQLPRASRTRGASTKTVKNYYLRKHKNTF